MNILNLGFVINDDGHSRIFFICYACQKFPAELLVDLMTWFEIAAEIETFPH